MIFRALIAGGGAPETELSLQLNDYANTLTGMEQYCFRAFAEALEVIPITLAENAGLNPIATVTELRNRHAQGEKTAGINVRKVQTPCTKCHKLKETCSCSKFRFQCASTLKCIIISRSNFTFYMLGLINPCVWH